MLTGLVFRCGICSNFIYCVTIFFACFKKEQDNWWLFLQFESEWIPLKLHHFLDIFMWMPTRLIFSSGLQIINYWLLFKSYLNGSFGWFCSDFLRILLSPPPRDILLIPRSCHIILVCETMSLCYVIGEVKKKTVVSFSICCRVIKIRDYLSLYVFIAIY